MVNPALNNTILKILWRLAPTPIARQVLANEVEINIGTPITTSDFDAALRYLFAQNLITATTDIIGRVNVVLSKKGREETTKIYG